MDTSIPTVVLQWITVPALIWLGYVQWQNNARLVKVETLLELIFHRHNMGD